MQNIDEIRLRQILNDRFDSAELKQLCFDLEIPYDDLSGGDAKTNKVIEMVA